MNSRFPFSLLALLACVLPGALMADSPDGVVTFNEVHYNPGASQDGEWVELHNQMAVNIDLSGWQLADGVSYTFPKGTIIAGGGFLVVAKTPGHPSLAGVAGVLGPLSGNLSNSGETVDLLSSSGRLMDRLEYSDGDPWPVAADGFGPALAKTSGGMASEKAVNWRASLQEGGSPGGVNFPVSDIPVTHELIDDASEWKYRHENAEPPAGWNGVVFDESGWSSGQAPLGTAGAAGELAVTGTLTSRYRAGAVTGVNNGATFSPWLDSATDDGVSQNLVRVSNPNYYVNRTPSGEPAIDFDGNDGFEAAATPGIGGNSGFVYYIVCKADGVPSSGGIAGGDGDYLFDRVPEVDAPLVSLKPVNGRYGFQIRYDNGSGLGGPVSSTSISTSNFQIVAVRRNPGLGRFEVWVDGVMEASMGDSGASLTPQPIVIGKHGSGNNGFDGDIAEVLIYNNELSEAQFMQVGSYLQARYGLETAFPESSVATELPGSTAVSYFRHTFQYNGEPGRTQLLLDQTLADGSVVYLNGEEVIRKNIADGEVGHGTRALGELDPPTVFGAEVISSSALVRGLNVLAVSVHAATGDNSSHFSAGLCAVEAPVDPNELPALEISEIAGVMAEEFFVELHNPHTMPLSTENFSIGVEGGVAVELADGVIAAGGFLVVSEAELGGRPLAGERLVLRDDSGKLLDVRPADMRLRGVSDKWPGRWLFPEIATPGTENSFQFEENLVINEICYNPVGVTVGSADKEWLELYNRGDEAIDLGAWRMDAGITYTFPGGTVVPARGFLVLAKAPASVSAPVVLGPYSGSLANGGELLRLVDAAGNPVDEVEYVDGGRWPGAADGEGSSLELQDADADNALPEAWVASNEGGRRNWELHSYDVVAGPSSVGPDNQWREFVFGMIGSGEVMIDGVSVIENPDTAPVQMILNGGFENGSTGWRLLGNHRESQVVTDPQNASNRVLLIKASGATEHMHNHIEGTLANNRQVVNGRTYRVSFRARWVSGSNKLNTRLYFNRAARTTSLVRTDVHGTPGAVNSMAVSNAGPGFYEFRHEPVVPAAGVPVTVSVRVADPDGVGVVTLFYEVDGGETQSVAMAEGAVAGNFSAAIPGQAAASVVRFYVRAGDAALVPGVSWYPRDGADSHAHFQVNDGLAATNGLHNLRIIMSPADKALLYETNNLMSNGRIGCTVIYNEREVYYDVGVRLKSSQRGRPVASRVGFNLGFNKDQLFRGVLGTVAIDRSEGQITGCQEILYDHMMYASGGVPAEFNDLCKVIAPNPAHTSEGILQLARFGNVFLDSQFENGSDGTVFEYELIYFPTTADQAGFKQPQPDSVEGINITNMGDDKEAYRWTYLQKNNEDADDYTRIMLMAKQFAKSGSAFNEGLDEILDVDQWLRALAYSCASGAGDSFFANARHNGQFYSRPDGRVLYFPHDMDFAYSATLGIFENNELKKLIASPMRLRSYLGHLHEICTSVFNASYMSTWTGHYGSLLPGQNFPGHLNYINIRSNYILNAINGSIPPVSFAIQTNGGNDFSTSEMPVMLSGSGWVDVRGIRLASTGQMLEVEWLNQNTWRVAVPLARGVHFLQLEALDHEGSVVGSDSVTVTQTGGGDLPSSATLVVSEIYYNPPGNQLLEYIELMNIGENPLDLSYVNFATGITFSFTPGTMLEPGGRVVVAKDPVAFAGAFGSGIAVAGGYPDNLSNGGELLVLRGADGAVLHSFSYGTDLPWPVEADGAGYSLVLVNPGSQPEYGDPFSWRASYVSGGSPGAADELSYAEWKLANGGHGDDEDRDGDGITTRLEYFLGGNPELSEVDLVPSVVFDGEGNLVMTATRWVGLGEELPLLQMSDDLEDWMPASGVELLSRERLGGVPTREQVSYAIARPVEGDRWFYRFFFSD